MKATLARLSRITIDPLAAGDGALLDAFIGGDQGAFAMLVRRHAGLVFATCRRVLRHQQDAEDAFQATFLVLARRAADVWPREALGSWLFGVAHRVALKARAVRSRRASRQKPLEETASPNGSLPECDLAEVVHRVVCKLPEVYRAAVVACDLEGLSRKEAAERLGWSEGTLSGRLARARELLATRLRRLGLALPAAGLSAVLATGEEVSAAALQATINFATGTAGASAPVVSLTEGVLRSMAFLKLKTMTVAVFAACAIGFGVLAASGAGAGDGADGQQSQTQTQTSTPTALAPPANEKAPNQPGKLPNEKTPEKPVTDANRLQGSWRVVSLTENEKTTPTDPKDPWVIEFTGGTMKMPYRELDGGWKQREYSFSVDETQPLRTIDLVMAQKPVGRGLYEFTAPATTCGSCHQPPNQPLVWKFGMGPVDAFIGVCGPGLKKLDLGVRLAISIDGKRPTKFGGPGVIIFELRRPNAVNFTELRPQPRVELAQQELEALLQELEIAGKGKIDPVVLDRLRARIRSAESLLSGKPSAPASPATAIERLTVAQLQKAQADLERAQAESELARADLAKAQAHVDLAMKKVQEARERVKAAEKAVAEAKPPAPAAPKEEPGFTIHIRTLTASEKVIRVKASGKEAVSDGLVYAGGDVLTKPLNYTVWVVREGTVIPVDLIALTQKADTKTDHPLKPGDQLFIQAKPAK